MYLPPQAPPRPVRRVSGVAGGGPVTSADSADSDQHVWGPWKSLVASLQHYPSVCWLRSGDASSWPWAASILRSVEAFCRLRPCIWPNRSALAASCRPPWAFQTCPAFCYPFPGRVHPHFCYCFRRWAFSRLLYLLGFPLTLLLPMRDCARDCSGLPRSFSIPRAGATRQKWNLLTICRDPSRMSGRGTCGKHLRVPPTLCARQLRLALRSLRAGSRRLATCWCAPVFGTFRRYSSARALACNTKSHLRCDTCTN